MQTALKCCVLFLVAHGCSCALTGILFKRDLLTISKSDSCQAEGDCSETELCLDKLCTPAVTVRFSITMSGYNITTFDSTAQQQFCQLVFEQLSNDLPDTIESVDDIVAVSITSVTSANAGVMVYTTVKAKATAAQPVQNDMVYNSSQILPYSTYGNVTVVTSSGSARHWSGLGMFAAASVLSLLFD
ncbi:TPA: hypothetical protein ACH3X3_000739 [Trebouxia sp. C0006]